MKKLTYLLLFISLNCSAQKNILSISYQVIDKGYGFRYDRLIDNYGFYGSVSKGSYQGSVSHYRYCVGANYKINPNYQYNPYFSFGVAYNQFSNEDKLRYISEQVWEPISMELGIGNHIGKVNICVRYDFMRNEAAFDVGYIF